MSEIAILLNFINKTISKIIFDQDIKKHNKKNKRMNELEINMQLKKLSKQKKDLIKKFFFVNTKLAIL